MKCYKCGGFLYEGDRCNVCGADVSVYREIVQESNSLYNRGLEYAKARNLSGAVRCLEISIKMYKNNINSRNLLGLIYYETGEFTLALAQWVISKNIQPENNLANEFINVFQKSRAELDKMNSAIKKYNKAIYYVRQGSYDLAEIQLKKLLNDNTHIVKGHQLLALLLIRKEKLADARVALKKAEKIDAGNPITIAYKAAVQEEIKEEEKDLSPIEIKMKRAAEQPEKEHAPLSGDDVIIPKSTYKEHNPTTMAIIQIIIGLLIGAAIVFFIVIPAKTSEYKNEISKMKTDYETQISSLNTKINELEGGSSQENSETAAAESTTVTEAYKTLLKAADYYADEKYEEAADLVSGLQGVDQLKDDDLKTLYNSVGKKILKKQGDLLWDSGAEDYEAERFAEAAEKFVKSYQLNDENEDSLYFAAVSYQKAANTEKAKEWFEKYIDKFPQGAHIEEANNYYNELG